MGEQRSAGKAAFEGEPTEGRRDGRSGRRRLPMSVAAAVLGLNLALVAVLVLAFTDTSRGSSAGASAESWVLPPTDAGDVSVVGDATESGFHYYSFVYTDSTGVPLELIVRPYDAAANPGVEPTGAIGLPPGAPFVPISVEGLRGTVATCVGIGSLATIPPVQLPPGSVLIGDGPMFVSPPMAGVGFLGGSVVQVRASSSRECRLDDAHVAEIRQFLQSLRYVSEGEWYAYTATKGQIVMSTPNDLPPNSSVHFDGEDRARAQVADAIAGLDVRLEDGSYPNLEGGETPNDYASMFLAAQEATGATPGATFLPVETWFRSENEAIVTFRITAQLPSGTATYSQTGSVVRVGERWVVSRTTVMEMLGRSRIGPS